jgi:Protein of unknown function (DUF3293)
LIVDALLTRMGARTGAFITAWNPFSKSQSVGTNALRDRELRRYLTANGFAFLTGEGRGQAGDWPSEDSVFALAMSRTRAACVGRRFLQNAIVYVPLGRPAELIMLRWMGQREAG